MQNKQARGKRTRAAARKSRRSARLNGTALTTVTVTFRHVEPTEPIRLYAERKLGHLGRYAKRACNAHLILEVDKYRHRGEVTVKSGSISATAEQESSDLYSVIDLLVDKVIGQLKRHLGKINTRRAHAVSTGELLSETEENLDQER